MIAQREMGSEGTAPERRRVVRAIQAINLVFLAVDLALHGPAPAVVGGRLLVSVALAGIEVVLARPLSPAVLRAWLCAFAVVLPAGFGVLALGTGAASSPYLSFLAFVPIVVGIVIPDEPAVNVAAGVGGAAVHLAFSLAARQGAGTAGFIALAYASCTFYGAVSATLYRRMRRRERSAWSAQVEATSALARSELRRAVIERAAAVGRIAAELGHELSNPVASASANLRFVEEELPRWGVDRDLVAAVRDSREALERVGQVVGDLRVLSPEGGWEAGEVDLAGAVEHGLQLAALRLGKPAFVAGRVPRDVPVRASSRHLSQVVSILVGLLGEGSPRGDPLGLDVALEDEAVRLALTSRGGVRAKARAEPEGAGVGLALCRELAEPWGGKVEARAAPGGGVEFAVTLRRAGLDAGAHAPSP